MGCVRWAGVGALFGFGAQADLHNASTQIANVAQGGLGLPDRDYYLDTDPKSVETREKYLEHMANMFVLLGDNADAAKKEAAAVMGNVTQIAESAFKRRHMRGTKNREHKKKGTERA